MKRYLTILILAIALPVCAQGQGAWWLFPGSRQREQHEQQNSYNQERNSETARPERQDSGDETEEYPFTFDFSGSMEIAMILPLKASGQNPSANFLEMYSGALLALRDLGLEGMKIDFEILDSSESGFDPGDHMYGKDIIIGPVEYASLAQAERECSRSQVIVSPLEPKAAELVSGGHIVQAPVPWTAQTDDLVEWLRSDCQQADEVIVIRDVSIKGNGEQSKYLIGLLQSTGTRYREISSVDELHPGKFGNYRILIASDSDAFITNAVKNIGIAASIHDNIILYTTSKVRNCVGPNVTDLYNANTRLTAAYYIDYSSEDVRKFILAYRSLFRSEPGSFAFQGYDLVKYFAQAYHRYGKKWADRLDDFDQRGLQSDFVFDRFAGDGRINMGVRRVIYGKDLSATLVQ